MSRNEDICHRQSTQLANTIGDMKLTQRSLQHNKLQSAQRTLKSQMSHDEYLMALSSINHTSNKHHQSMKHHSAEDALENQASRNKGLRTHTRTNHTTHEPRLTSPFMPRQIELQRSTFSMEKEFRGYKVALSGGTEDELNWLWDSNLVKDWVNSLDPSIVLKSVELQSKILADNGDPKYLKLSTVSERCGGIIPRIIILDGKSIAPMVVINGKSLALVERPRIATGSFRKEIPNINTDGRPVSRELACEFTKKLFGVECSPEDFVDLIQETTSRVNQGVHPYCGPCDRQTFYFLVRLEMTEEEVEKLRDKPVGPNMNVRLVDLEEVGKAVNDFVTLAGMFFYKTYMDRSGSA